MTDRRPLGTGPVRTNPPHAQTTEQLPTPRAQVAAERLPVAPASAPERRRTAGRRALGTGPTSPRSSSHEV
ncbi:hypothetical protein DV517_74400 [Streptomyces sp. S816]|nr:hypothetical protein DV517_74400 [Streptomyces sp. S816]